MERGGMVTLTPSASMQEHRRTVDKRIKGKSKGNGKTKQQLLQIFIIVHLVTV